MTPGTQRFERDGGTLFMLRHGAVDADGVKRYLGQTDLSLSREGRRQAGHWARWFAGVPVQRIVCSDLKRSAESAEIIGKQCGIAPQTFAALREIDLGQWEGLAFSEVKARFPGAYEQRGRDLAGWRPPGGESFGDLRRRVVACFEHIRAGTPENILFVGHAGVNRVLLCHLLGLPLQRLFGLGQDHAGLSIVNRVPGGADPAFHRLTLLNGRF